MQAQDCQEEEDEYVFAVIGGKITVYIGGIIGTFIENLTVGSKCISAEFTVIKERKEPLLGSESAIELGVLKLQGPLNLVADYSEITRRSKDIFTGIGKFKDFQLKLHIDQQIQLRNL